MVTFAIKKLGSLFTSFLPDFKVFESIGKSITGFFTGTDFGGFADKIAEMSAKIRGEEIKVTGSAGVAVQEVKNQSRIDGTINVNAPAGVLASTEMKVSGTAMGNLGLNMVTQ